MKYRLLIFFIVSFQTIYCQVITFERVLGTSAISYGFDVIELSTGEYVVAGVINPFGSFVFMAKITNTGEIIWEKQVSRGGCSAQSILETNDGGFLLGGNTTYTSLRRNDVYIVKTNLNGDTLWTKSIGDTLHENTSKMIKTNDGGYAIIGWADGDEPDNYFDVYLLKLDENCEIQWYNKYGGEQFDKGHDLLQLDDGGYIIVGETSSYGQGMSDVYLIKTNSLGDTLWTRNFGGINTDRGHAVAIIPGGGYLIAGTKADFMYLIRVTNDGDVVWTHTTEGGANESASSIAMTSDGNYIITGNSTTFNPLQSELYLLKIDINGNLLWSRTIGSDEWDAGRTVRQTTDSGYIITGHTYRVSNRPATYLVKTDEEGLLDIFSQSKIPTDFSLIQNYPNPFNPTTTIQYELPQRSDVHITIYDLLGRKVTTLVNQTQGAGSKSVTWNATNDQGRLVGAGVYLYQIQAGQFVQTKKMVLLK